MSTSGASDPPLRTLHVACMPFPTSQGTQAIVGMMVRALRAHGHEATLLTYAHGLPLAAGERAVEPLRLGDWPRVRSVRSGPSLGKVALDLRMVAAVRAQLRRAPFDAVVAHNVEAAWVCAAAGSAPWVYYAHTSMREELPHYLPSSGAALGRASGALLDRGACLRSAAVFALTPALQARLAPLHADVVTMLPPFERPLHAAPERAVARAELGLSRHAYVALYAGNLDAYQGVALLIEALARSRRPWQLVVATESAREPLRALAAAAGVSARVTFAPLTNELDRARAHAAADLALVPRRAPGGLPIKLLDALARGLPVVATESALAGLELAQGVRVVPDDDPDALADAVEGRGLAPAPTDVLPGPHVLDAIGLTDAAFAERFTSACARVRAGASAGRGPG